MLNSRLIAVQGIGLTPIAIAVQGLIDYIVAGGSTTPSNEVEVTIHRKKHYIRRKKKILIFDTAEQADDYLEAEAQAEQAIAKAKKTSRLARKRIRDRIVTVTPEVVDVGTIESLADRFDIGYQLPELLAQQEYDAVMRIYELAMQMLDEEDVELLLMA